MTRYASRIVSVFGQLDKVAAEIMVEQGKLKRIETKDFSKGAPLIDEHGRYAFFAVIIPNKAADRELEQLTAQLRA